MDKISIDVILISIDDYITGKSSGVELTLPMPEKKLIKIKQETIKDDEDYIILVIRNPLGITITEHYNIYALNFHLQQIRKIALEKDYTTKEIIAISHYEFWDSGEFMVALKDKEFVVYNAKTEKELGEELWRKRVLTTPVRILTETLEEKQLTELEHYLDFEKIGRNELFSRNIRITKYGAVEELEL